MEFGECEECTAYWLNPDDPEIAWATLPLREFLGLRWSDVDFDNDVINIRHAKTPFAKDSEDTTKTPCNRRSLPMPQYVKTICFG